MKIHVLKFGGTSMNDHQTWKQVLDIIKKYEYPVVVVSATARTTRQLIESAKLAASGKLDHTKSVADEIRTRHQLLVDSFLEEHPHPKNTLIKESCDKKIEELANKLKKLLEYVAKTESLEDGMKDAIAAIGEQISSFLLAQCGLAVDMLTQFIDAKKIIKTDTEYGKANPNRGLINQKSGAIETILDSGFTPIIGGFYGEAQNGTTTTLGFEGSDYSASLIGGALNAEAIEIWTDVSGIYTSDPRFITDAKPIPELSYFDATEMAYFGAKVLHPSTLKPAQERNIPVFVKNMFTPDDTGTKIVRESDHNRKILAMSFKDDIVLLTVSAYETVMGYSFLTKVFAALEKLRLPVDAVNTTEASVTIALSNSEKLDNLSQELIEVGTITMEEKKGLVSLIGCRISKVDKLTNNVFSTMGSEEVDMITFTKEKRILSFVVDEERLVETAQNIHSKLFN
ncbi:MAG: lysine-sensitive aspartokinase 3 [Balneolaceae bacterium]